MSFFGENPFAVKRDAIENTMTWLFTGVTLLGLLLQVLGEVLGDRLKARRHRIRVYAVLSVGGLLATAVLVLVLTTVGNHVAKRSWLPKVVTSQSEAYRHARFIVEHNGWREDQLSVKDALRDADRYRRANLEQAERAIEQIEKLLELPTQPNPLQQRVTRLGSYFREQ